jgi:hypothetical protein
MEKAYKHWVLRGIGVIGLALIAAAGLLVGAALPASTDSSSSKATAVSGSSWASTATHLRGLNGRVFTFRCPKQGVAHRVWGTGTYTDDSSVCTAAVHAGRITRARGGMVKIRIRPGLSYYRGTTRHGITSHRWGKWRGSFVVLSATALPGPRTTTTTSRTIYDIDWPNNATGARGQNTTYSYRCPSGGVAHPVWGTDTYTDDSSICTAAVHAGRITFGGGVVTIKPQPGLSGYVGSTRNGVTSQSWGAYRGSFIFVS